MPSQFYRKVISLSKTPTDFQKNPQSIEKTEQLLSSTVEDSSASTVEDRPLWRGEGADGIFALSRVRKILRAQDALTHVEEAVYDILWGSKKRNEEGEEERLAQMGYAELADKSRVSKRTIQSVVERLIEKGFIRIQETADIYHRKPTVYRVLGYGAVLRWMRSTGRRWVLRTGRGVFYAQMLPSTVEDRTPSTVEARSSSTVEASAPSTVEVPSTTSLGNKKEAVQTGTPPSSSSSVVEVCHRYGVSLDAAAAKLIPRRCRTYDPAATDEEITHFTEVKILQLRGSTRIGNIVGLLLTAVPEFFVEPAHEVNLYREERSAAAGARLETERQAAAMMAEEKAKQQSEQIYGDLSVQEQAIREEGFLTSIKADFPKLTLQEQKRIAKQRAMLVFHQKRTGVPAGEGKS